MIAKLDKHITLVKLYLSEYFISHQKEITFTLDQLLSELAMLVKSLVWFNTAKWILYIRNIQVSKVRDIPTSIEGVYKLLFVETVLDMIFRKYEVKRVGGDLKII